MKCQNCNSDDARIFIGHWNDNTYEMCFCDDCLERMWQHAGNMGQKEAFRNLSGWWPGKPEPRQLGDYAFPELAGEELRRRRRISALKIRLEEAALSENYEEAARLRDRLQKEQGEAVKLEH